MIKMDCLSHIYLGLWFLSFGLLLWILYPSMLFSGLWALVLLGFCFSSTLLSMVMEIHIGVRSGLCALFWAGFFRSDCFELGIWVKFRPCGDVSESLMVSVSLGFCLLIEVLWSHWIRFRSEMSAMGFPARSIPTCCFIAGFWYLVSELAHCVVGL